MPRLLQWLRDKNSSASSQSHSYQQHPKPLYLEHSTQSDVEAGGPWTRSGSTAAILADNYIRLEEQSRVDGLRPYFEIQRDRSEGPAPATLTYPLIPQTQNDKSVRKTVRAEPSYSA